jgi:hypothetical protein
MFLDVWSLNLSKKPLPNPFPRLLQGDVTSPGHQNDGHSERKGFTSHLVSFWMRWIFRRFLSPEMLEKKEREREERRLYDCYVMIHRFLEVSWPGDESETPKIVQKTRFFSGLSAPGPRVGARLCEQSVSICIHTSNLSIQRSPENLSFRLP